MKKIKIIVDIIMSITLFFLVVIYITGNNIHEILGILFILEFTIHKLLNIKNIVILFKQALKDTCKRIVKITVITDIILTVMMILSCVSGIYISKYLFNIQSNYYTFWYITHVITSYLAVLVVLFHIFTHAKYIVNAINNMIKIKYNRFQEYLFNSFLIVCLGLFINLFIKNETINKMKTIYYLNKEQVEMKNETINNKSTSDNEVDNIEEEVVVKSQEEYDTTQKIESTKDQIVTSVKVEPTTAEITEHLSSLRCDGCKKRCLLTFPQCMIGEKQAEIETTNYIENYTAN